MNDGAALASVEPLPGGSDQGPVPSAFVARTCTSYSVSSASPVIVALNSVIVSLNSPFNTPGVDFTQYR